MVLWIACSATLVALAALVLRMLLEGTRPRSGGVRRPVGRSEFEHRLESELERARRHERVLALIVADVDCLERVTALLGRRAGDVVTEQVGAIMCDAARRPDTVAHLSGGRFALVLPEADERGALGLAERLRLEIQEAFSGGFAEITVSFGLASHPKDGEQAERLLEAAERALELAERLGRNRAVVFGDETVRLLTELTSGS